jgi:thioredoxin reductase
MSTEQTDVTVVGAGAAGIGIGVALSMLDINVRILEREEIGASFRRWPDEMRFITPSFPSNSFGLTDLNAVTPDTSPAFTLDCEHPSGDEYADYLESVAEFYELPVETGVAVTGIQPRADSPAAMTAAADGGTAIAESSDEGFMIETTDGPLSTEHVVWAAGHFGNPRADVVDGSEHCRHTSTVDSWQEHVESSPTNEFLVIGGYESGIDAAVGLHEAGASVQVVDRGWPWAERHPDPSEVLSPYTLERLDTIAESDRLSVDGGTVVERVSRTEGFRVDVRPADRETPPFVESTAVPNSYTVPTRPLLATGFEPTLGPAEPLFSVTDGAVELTDRDESTETPGLFLAGPDVVHNGVMFCFIYKFRARFPVVAAEIGNRLGVDTDALEVYREQNMFLDDLSCCETDMCDC